MSQTYSSQNPDYITNVKLGEESLNNESYDSCMIYYRKAFQIQQTSTLSTLRMAACAYSGGYANEYDIQMKKAIDLSWSMTKNIFNGYDEFSYLRKSSFEEDLNALADKKAEEEGINIQLMKELAQIRITDQAQRKEMRNFEWGSPEMDSLWALQNYSDSVNLVRIEEMIAEYGYPGKSLVGEGQASTAFLVIQHAHQEAQEKYLPLLKEEANKGEIRWASVALLIDRVYLKRGDKQVYGSQINRTEDGEFYVMRLEDPENINKKRAEVGLGPIDDYCSNWDFKFDIKRHKEIWAANELKSKEDKN